MSDDSSSSGTVTGDTVDLAWLEVRDGDGDDSKKGSGTPRGRETVKGRKGRGKEKGGDGGGGGGGHEHDRRLRRERSSATLQSAHSGGSKLKQRERERRRLAAQKRNASRSQRVLSPPSGAESQDRTFLRGAIETALLSGEGTAGSVYGNPSRTEPPTHRNSSRDGKDGDAAAAPTHGTVLSDEDTVSRAEMDEAMSYFSKKKKNKALSRGCCYWLLWYLPFVLLVFSARSVLSKFELHSSLHDILLEEEFDAADAHIRKDFSDIGEVQELWQWLEGPLLNGVGQSDPAEESFILMHNRLLGSVRLRQLRVKETSCKITEKMRRFMPGCYADYTPANRDEENFGPCAGQSSCDIPGFSNFEETGAPPQVGRLTTYDAGGFVVDLSYNSIVAAEQLAALRENEWVDRQTKAVIVTVNVYNQNVNLFSSMAFVIELNRGGGIYTRSAFHSFPADFTLTSLDVVLRVLEWILAFSILFMDIMLISSIISKLASGKNIFFWLLKPWWNCVNVVNLIFLTTAVILYILFVGRVNAFRDSIDNLDQDADFIQMESLGYDWNVIFTLFAASFFLSTFYFFKFLNANVRMAQLWQTLQRAGTDLASFIVFFFIIFLSFVGSGHLIFGTEVESWSTFNRSFFTCFKTLLGDFDYEEIREKHQIVAPFYFTTFVVLNTFILLNMFLAILNASWDALQEDLEAHPSVGESLRYTVLKQVDSIKGTFQSCRGGGGKAKLHHARHENKISLGKKLADSFQRKLFGHSDVEESETGLVGEDEDRLTVAEFGARLGMDDDRVTALRHTLEHFREKNADRSERLEEQARQANTVTISDHQALMFAVLGIQQQLEGIKAALRQAQFNATVGSMVAQDDVRDQGDSQHDSTQ